MDLPGVLEPDADQPNPYFYYWCSSRRPEPKMARLAPAGAQYSSHILGAAHIANSLPGFLAAFHHNWNYHLHLDRNP